MLLLSPSLLTLSLAATALAKDLHYDWNVMYLQANPDGKLQRRVITVNNVWPPPPIEASIGDRLLINVQNSLDVPTTLHAHGVLQNKTTFMDGAAYTTQCGIPAGQKFTYTIPVEQTGTYWIHSHYHGQYADGIRAPLIFKDPEEKKVLGYDEEYTISLADWYRGESMELIHKYINPLNPGGIEPVPHSALINGKTTDTFQFLPGKTYRLRIINMAALAAFYVEMPGHTMEIIEADGIHIEKVPIEILHIASAQRYSVLVKARPDASKNYKMHVTMDDSMFDSKPEDLTLDLEAIIRYNPTETFEESQATEEFDHVGHVDDTLFVPLVPEGPAEPDTRIELNAFFGQMTDGTNRGMFNNISYVPPKTPTLFTALSTGELANDPRVYGKYTNTFVVKHMEMVEMIISNWDEGMHPFHLHGHQFQLLVRSNEPYDAQRPIPVNPNPSRRDTIVIASGGHAIIRFRADNPGVWLFHCHIDWHVAAGLQATIVEAPAQMQSTLRSQIPSFIAEQCHTLGFTTSGNAHGEEGVSGWDRSLGVDVLEGEFTGSGVVGLVVCVLSALIGMGFVVWGAEL